jgi:hypothetical protein
MARSLTILALLAALLLTRLEARAQAGEPHREDHGDLIVLHVYGSYEEMGRQQAELLGPVLRRVYEAQHDEFERGLAQAGTLAAIQSRLLFPGWAWIGPSYEESGFHDEINGMAAGLGVAPADVLRALFALSGAGSTVFVATRSATADGKALIGRNVDWNDADGARRPIVVDVHPDNGDLAHLFVGWPLVGLPTVGLNEAGLAISLNFFVADSQVGMLLPQWPHRRILQKAKNVAEAIEVAQGVRLRGIAGYLALADASGDIALLECLPERCSVFRPREDWFGHSNHARTPEMIPHDRYRSPDSFARRAGMEKAVLPYLGKLTPQLAAGILRDRGGARYANESTVGNLIALNSAIVHPASGTLWHSTTMQPHAPFGAYFALHVGPGEPAAWPEIPADPWLDTPAAAEELDVVSQARHAIRLADDGRLEEARAIWDLLGAMDGPLNPTRIAWERALVRWRAGELEAAYDALAPLEAEDAAFDARAHGLVARGVLADSLGRRDEALRLYALAEAHLDTHPEYTFFAPLRARIAAGRAAPLAADSLPATEHWMNLWY